jgi:hypothetical protein
MLQWSGTSKKKSGALWSGIGLCVLTAVEVMDGYSAEWGASWDIIANAAGTALYVSQELIWEQRITPKFSFHTTKYASFRPSVLGSSFSEQILKIITDKTYWLSINLNSFAKTQKNTKMAQCSPRLRLKE